MIELLILEMILFVIGMYLLKKYDDKAGIKVSKKEYVIMGLIFAAFIDYQTKRVYRIGSIGFILVAMLVFTFVKDMSSYDRLEKLLCVLIFSMFSVMQGTLELFAVYMLLANCIFLILNMKNFDWKRRKLKEDAAFLPGMAGALVILELSRLLN